MGEQDAPFLSGPGQQSWVVGTDQRVIMEQLEWFARDVMPAFKRVPSFA